jgi:1,4-dihydroxy-2-naphthoate octaprenyltransferase
MSAMKKSFIHNLKVVIRVEFIPANSASVIIGFAWAIRLNDPLNIKSIGFLFLLFVVLSSIGTLGAHWNSYSDYELDQDDPLKIELHRSLFEIGKEKLLRLIWVEVFLAGIIFIAFWLIHKDFVFLVIWLTAIFLAFAYSMPPFRFKAKGLFAFVSLCMVLSILPVLFVYLSTNPSLSTGFLIFLLGHTLIIYSLIIPTEIRDFFVDQSHQVKTMTVWLGLKKASGLAIGLLFIGTVMVVGSYSTSDLFTRYPLLLIFLLVIIAANGFVFSHFLRLRKLICQSNTDDLNFIKKAVELAVDNPKWITISSMGSLSVALIMILGKLILK